MVLEFVRHLETLDSVFIDDVKYIEVWKPRKYSSREGIAESEYTPSSLFIVDHQQSEAAWIGADVRLSNDKTMTICFDTILYIRSSSGDLIRKYVANFPD